MTSCRSILLLLLHQFYLIYCTDTSIPPNQTTKLPTIQPSTIPTIERTLEVTALNQIGECNNPTDAKSHHDYISLSTCIEFCENDDCVMIQYYDKLQSDTDSRCYIFDEICDISQNVGPRANSSHIYYKNQFTINYCVDYRNWNDKYLDDCNAYVTHGLCLNRKMTAKTSLERFEQAKDPIHNWNALEACCECGGGKYVFDNVAVTYVNEYNVNDELQECSFKNDTTNTTSLAKWNNFALNQLIEGINYPLNSDIFIYKYLSNMDSTISYTLGICNFSSYDITAASHDIYTDFFILAIDYIETEEYTYFVNSEYFDIDLNVISSVLKVEYYSYQQCNDYIMNASLSDHSAIDMIVQCFEHNTPRTSVPTLAPEIEEVTEYIEVTVEISQTQSNEEEIETYLNIYGYYTINERNWIYVTIACAALCVFVSFCLFCCIRKCKRKKRKIKKTQLQTVQTLSKHEQVPTQDIDSDIDVNDVSNSGGDKQIIISMPNEDTEYETDEKEELIKDDKRGLLVFQKTHYTEEQMQHIFCQHYEMYKSVGSTALAQPPKMLFGDNDEDNRRKYNIERLHSGGQARTMGPYDRSIAYGIITAFYKSKPNTGEFMNLMDEQFKFLQKHLLNGNDVVVPKPTQNDVSGNKSRYCINGKQIIFHNIGTGIARLPLTHLQYIQKNIDELRKYARNTKTVTYYSYCAKPSKSKSLKIKKQIVNMKKELTCPWGGEQCGIVHYLIKLKNCDHRLCEGCLVSYIIEHLNYSDTSEDHRFKCYITKTGKCPNGIICMEDIRVPDDKCYCDECKQNNTDTGNGTILDDESYRQFKYIMDAFGTKSYHDIDDCPNVACKKPFQIDRPWRHKKDNVTNGYYYERKISFFDDVVINENECNCCGKKLSNEMTEMEEIAITAYQTANNCRICHQYYCDNCRSNCFYEIERDYTVKPPTPVSEAMMQFNREQKLRKVEMETIEFERFHLNNKKIKLNIEQHSEIESEAFECCEVCWYRFYGRQCPHCNHRFCGICHGKWSGVTQDWHDKIKNFHEKNDDEKKYGGDNLYTYIDEKNGKHDGRAHHSCAAELKKLKLKKKEMKRCKSMQIMANKKMKIINRKLKDEERRNIKKRREITRKEEQIKQLQNEKEKQKVELVTLKRELENTILKLEKKKLIDESDSLQVKLVTTREEKKRILEEKVNAEHESKKYKAVAEEERKQREIEKEEFKQFRKQLFVHCWKWNDNGKWTSYEEDINKKIEALSIGGSLTFKVSKTNYKIIRTEECKGTQENLRSKYKRDIHRVEVTRGYIRYPKFWNVEGFDMGNDEGGAATGLSYAEPKLVQLNINQSPAKEVANEFYATSKQHHKYKYSNIKIISIESVQNQRLYDKYWRERSVLMREIGQSKLNEKYLWHGTRTVQILDLIKKEGFRREFNKTAQWGQGDYFAVNSGYSVSYASNVNGIRKMFQCKVLCGESILGSGGYKLNSWPKKQNKLIYDSLHSKEKDIYVIHEDVRAYPMFVVTFKMN